MTEVLCSLRMLIGRVRQSASLAFFPACLEISQISTLNRLIQDVEKWFHLLAKRPAAARVKACRKPIRIRIRICNRNRSRKSSVTSHASLVLSSRPITQQESDIHGALDIYLDFGNKSHLTATVVGIWGKPSRTMINCK